MAILYHISTNMNHTGQFIIGVPINRFDGENSTIKRVCTAPKIADCFTSIPSGGSSLNESSFSRRGYYLVFKIDTDKLNIEDKDIVYPDKLYMDNLVQDAMITNEHWITKSFEVPMEDRFVIVLNDWDEETLDVVSYDIYKLAKEKYEGDIGEAYYSIHSEYPYTIKAITNVNYKTPLLNKGENINIYFNYSDEEEQITSMLEEIEDIDFKSEDYKIEIFAKENVDLTDVFLAHIDYLQEIGSM